MSLIARFVILAGWTAAALFADPYLDLWIRAKSTIASAPDVHRVSSDERFVYVESAGLSLQSFGALEARPFDGAVAIRHLTYRIPRAPKPSAACVPVSPGAIGTFINGVPIYAPGSVLSYRDQNLWRLDAVAQSAAGISPLLGALMNRSDRHSPLIGFAFDGYPIYGPFGWDENRRVKRFGSSYRLRGATSRRRLDGIELTPAQEGPAVDAKFPAGTFVEDYEYVPGSGDLDEHNGRFAVTPEFPQGTYAYFLATRPDGSMAYPYLIGPTYGGEFEAPTTAGLHRYGEGKGLRVFTAGPKLKAGEDSAFTIESPYPALEKVHEKPMHLLLISQDLEDFHHIHPDELTSRLYRVTHRFAHGGSYWLFVDHTPPGGVQTIARFRIEVDGPAGHDLVAAPLAVRAALEVDGPLRTGRDIPLRFRLRDDAGNAVSDLQPYLGAWGHIMIVSRNGEEFIHAHPLEKDAGVLNPWEHSHAAPGPSPSEIETTTGFRAPGMYKIWLQVQRDGQVLTFPFTVQVAAGEAKKAAAATKAIEITVSSQGFQPARLEIPAGRPVRLAFRRLDAQNCAQKVVFPSLGLERALPPGETVVIDVPAQASGELHFACGMGMYRGSLQVRGLQ